ncbi:MAG: quinol:cytochrome C oxidoreductase, partial [Ginsengibacter sp.]
MNNQYVAPAGFRKWSLIFMIAGLLTLILGIIFLNPIAGSHGYNVNSTRFWAVLLQNSLFWLMLVNVSIFFIVICTLAMGGWQVAFRRVTEAIGSLVPVMGAITFIILLCIIFGNRADIYPWLDKTGVQHDKILRGKSGFLNPAVYLIASLVVIALWSFIGKKLNDLSRKTDETGPMDYDTSKKWLKTNMGWSAYYIVLYLLSVGSIM